MDRHLKIERLDVDKNRNFKFIFLSDFAEHRYHFHFSAIETQAWLVYAPISTFESVYEFATYVLALQFLRFDHYDYKAVAAREPFVVSERTADEIAKTVKGIFETYRSWSQSYFLNIELISPPASIQDGLVLINDTSEQIVFFKEQLYYVGIFL